MSASSALRLLAGELKKFGVRCDSGRNKECAFCPACGTRIYHQVNPTTPSTANPGS